MQPQRSYHIEHIWLNRLSEIPEWATQQKGNYLVFWWKDMAIGHIYIEPHQSLPTAAFREKVKTAILPCLEFYWQKAPQIAENWQQGFLQGPLEEWKAFMDNLLKAWLPQEVPNRVPVSVVICTRNRPALLEKCLVQLQNLTCLPEEIIVVDNAPCDDASQQVVQQFKNATYVREPRPGLDFARNSGVFKASCPVIAFVDDDVTVHPLWIYRVWETFQNPMVEAMTGLVLAAKLETEAQQIFEKHWSFNRGYVDKFYDSHFFNATLHKGPPVWDIGAGANMAFRKSVFKNVGYFDELLDVGAAGCNGDSEMWFRILSKGHIIHFNPRAVVHHEHRSDLEGLKNQIYYYLRGFTVAALKQQKLVPTAGYNRQLFKRLPIHFTKYIIKGFPHYPFQYKTLWVEIKGVASGLAFYAKNRKRFDHSTPQHHENTSQ